MSFLMAFLFGGAICALVQVFLKLKLSPTVILTGAICLGGLLGALGILGRLSAVGGAGVGVQILSCGEALVGTFMAALAGDPSGLLMLSALLLFTCLVLGLGTGAIKHRQQQKQPQQSSAGPK